MSAAGYQWINFIVLFGFLGYIIKKKLDTFFSEQRKKLKQDMEDAGAQHAKIRQEYDELTSLVSRADAKIQEMTEISKKEAEIERNRVQAETKRVIEKMTSDSEARVRAEGERAKLTLEKELFEAALSQAKEALKKELATQNTDWTSQFIQNEAGARGKKNYAS